MKRSAGLAAAFVLLSSLAAPASGQSWVGPPAPGTVTYHVSSDRPRPIYLEVRVRAQHGTAGVLQVRFRKFREERRRSPSFVDYDEFSAGALGYGGDRQAGVGCQGQHCSEEGLTHRTYEILVDERRSTSDYYFTTFNARAAEFRFGLPGWTVTRLDQPLARIVTANEDGSAGAGVGVSTDRPIGLPPAARQTFDLKVEHFAGATAAGGRYGSIAMAFLPCREDAADPRSHLGAGEAVLAGGAGWPKRLTCASPRAVAEATGPTVWTLRGQARGANGEYTARLVVIDLPRPGAR